MTNKQYSNSDGAEREDGDDHFGSADVNAAANAFRRNAADALTNAEIGKTKDFLGFIKMDAGLADMLEGGYNVGADLLLGSAQPKIFHFVEENAAKFLKVNPETAKTVAAVATIGSNIAARAAGYVGPLVRGISNQYKQRIELAHELSPVLDDLKGSHSLAALYLTGEKDNEVIDAHRQRLGSIAYNQNLNNATNLAINSGASLILDGKNIMHMWRTKSPALPPIATHGDAGQANGHAQQTMNSWEAFKTGARGLMPQVAKRFAATSDYKLQKELQPYSAWEMIKELAEQVESNPRASGFTVPASFQHPRGRREQYPLREYLMRICIQHQDNMSYINPKHTQIRPALRGDLAAAIEPVAEAIENGDYKVIDLVHLVGEGKLIKNKGRAIATADEIEALIHHDGPGATSKDKQSHAKQPKSAVHQRTYSGKMRADEHVEEQVPDDAEDRHTGRESQRRTHKYDSRAAYLN